MKAVLFDCDGTLIDSEEVHYLAWKAAFQEMGRTLEKQYYIDHFCGLGDVRVAEIARELFGVSDLDGLVCRKDSFYEEYQQVRVEPIAETVEFFLRLHKEKERLGIKLAVVSGARKADILSNLEHIGIDSHFDAILSGKDDVSEYFDLEGTNKPKPYVYLKAAKVLSIEPNECIAIEDSRVGIAAAVGAGCFTIAVPNAFTRDHDLSLAHLRIDSFAKMSVDDFFARC